MAKKEYTVGKNKPPVHSQFKKGKSGNPLGGKIHKPEIRRIKGLTEKEVVKIGTLVLKGSVDELRAIAKNGKASALKCMMAAVAVRTISRGDPQALDALLNRLIGRVKDKVEVSGPNSGPQVILNMPSNGRENSDTNK